MRTKEFSEREGWDIWTLNNEMEVGREEASPRPKQRLRDRQVTTDMVRGIRRKQTAIVRG